MSRGQQKQLDPQSPSTSNQKRQQNQNWNLDPSLLVSQNSSNNIHSSNPAGCRMTLRRRGIQCQSSSTSSLSAASKHEIILPLNSTYLPKEEVRDSITKTNRTNKDKHDQIKDRKECNKDQHQQQHQANDKIFSITTYVALFIAVATLFGVLCSCVSNRASLLVSAQYSNYAMSSNGNNNNHYHQNHHHQNNHHYNNGRQSAQHSVNRQDGDTSHLAAVSQRADHSLSKLNGDGSPSDVHTDQQNDERRWSKKSSIDRYDSGEQIRPPLLRQPTTLAPLKITAQQASVNNQHNLEEAASQDSYLSPEDREQFQKSQDSHYEGKSMEAPSSTSYDGFNTERDNYDKSSTKRWSQPLQDVPEQAITSSNKQNTLQYKSNRPEASAATRAGSNPVDNDDGDYEEESAEPAKRGHSNNMVPELRRGTATGSASYNHQRPSMARSQSAAASRAASAEMAANEESDPNDDYGGGSDDSHFSRKSQQQSRSPNLNLAASHNQQLNRGLESGGGGGGSGGYPAEGSHSGGGTGISESNSQDEGPGFGPGPNEAFLAEEADVGKDQDGDEGLYSQGEGSPGESNGIGGGGGGGGEEAGENGFDRRSMNSYPTKPRASSYNSNPINYGQPIRAQANLFDNGDSEGDTEDGNDAPEESGSTFAPSLKTEVKSRAVPDSLNLASEQRSYNNYNSNNLSPKTSASALTPQSATFNHLSSPIITVPSPILSGSKPTTLQAANLQQQPFYRQQVHPNRQTQNQLVNNVATATPTSYQRASLNAPYNPQNNPSHAGKYFIN